MQNLLIFRIAEVHMVKNYISLHRLISCRIVCLMIMLPRPETCTLFAFRQFSIRLSHGVHQLHIPLVHLRLLVHELEDPVRAGQGHDDAVELLADLGDGLGKVSVQIQIGDQGAEGQAPHAVQGQDRPQHRAQPHS